MKQQDFEEFIRQVEPSAQESAQAWGVAIGLQAVDGLKPSSYLIETAKRNIEGDFTIDEVCELLDTYYRNMTARTPQDDETEEADKVSANIKKILSTRTMVFNTNDFISIHPGYLRVSSNMLGKFESVIYQKGMGIERGYRTLSELGRHTKSCRL